ncbi:MAG: 30S ribosomal protein S2 [Proteobacteria bacterium]|nr:30S ribosomal protein S2 [Pseudomonadota bacterium]
MTDVSMRRMLEAGVHFGHQTRFWNPKMAPFIFGERNRIHIINLERTLPLYQEACEFIRRVIADGGTVLFVGSKRAARQAISEEAVRCGMPYVSHRWLGGMLTNFKTIRKSVARLKELEEITADEARGDYTKKEILGLSRERDKLERTLGGIKDMESLPDAVFVVDVGHEEIAVREAIKLGIPIVAVVDTNSSPDEIDYVVPGNDDAMGAIRLYAHGAAEAVLEGKSSIPDVPVGDDEFVELDAEGKPKVAGGRRPGRGGVRKRPARKAVVRKKQSKLSAVRDAAAEEAPVPGPAATVAAPSDEAAKAEPPAEATEAPEAESSTEESAPADASGTDTPDAVKAAEAEAADPEVTEAADVDAEVAEPDGNDAGESDASGAEPAGEEMAGDEAGTDSAPEPDAEKAAEPDDGQAV